MTVGTPAWIAAAAGSPSYDATELRAIGTMYATYDGASNLGARPGVRPGGTSAIVAITGTTWTVATGVVGVSGISNGALGEYRVPITAIETGAVPARNATFDRKDIIFVRVYDAENGDASRAATVEYLSGVPASVPVAPGLPAAKCFLLSTVTVPKTGGPAISYVDDRSFTVAAGAILPTKTRPGVPYPGQTIYNLTSGILEFYNGTTWLPLSGGPPAFFTQTVAGTATWTKPANAKSVTVEIWGPGGAGGGTTAAAGQGEGGGGGGGGYVRKTYDAAALNATEAFTIGAGGASASGASGNSGGSATTFKGLSAGAGGGGSVMANGTTDAGSNQGSGGAASGGDLNLVGGDGGKGRRQGSFVFLYNFGGPAGGPGGSLVQFPNFGAGNGSTGQVPGGGGSGAYGSSTTARAGGAGAVGKILIITTF